MRRTIYTYEGIMIDKILACKTTFEVLSIIDKKVELIKKRTTDKSIVYRFVNSSLFKLRYMDETKVEPTQFSLIRAAVTHLKNLEIRYKLV